MQKGKTLRDLVILDRYIAEREAELRRAEVAARLASGSGEAHAAGTLAVLRQSIHVLRARREVLGGNVK
ncbi:hypothetical protein SAMN04488595_107170 [Ralstonia sp. 25mfcol4.1]|uniref:hypothetical protein n=1 Tax=Burkholderiaceae TaxID=119060 RepID=UPI00087E3F05|nr:hypothetical protein [Ralstonia sp. 25mfcol4.1]SDP33397.1 hypothetical protein SAMN04488595_107170 [Ralstonia sp. 25mfcol4.1]